MMFLSESEPLPSGRQVLVVEDEALIRNMLSQALREMGFRAKLTPSAEAGLQALAVKAYDILIVDLNLPGMGGLEFLHAVRKVHSDIPFIILTGFGDLESAKQAIKLEVVEFLTKPCQLGSLEIALDRAYKRRKGYIVNEADASAKPRLQFETRPKYEFPDDADAAPAMSGSATATMDDVEQSTILATLRKNDGNRTATANELQISLRKLFYRLRQYQKRGIEVPLNPSHEYR